MKRKSKIVMLIASLAIFACSDSDRVKERPDPTFRYEVDPAVFQKIVEQFPENADITKSKSFLFDAGARKEIVLSEESNVYLAFISEGAGYANSFGWYAYTPDSKPSTKSEVDMKVLFPHVSDQVLLQGDMLQLGDGPFPAGTVIGFFLIIRGWDYGKINYDGETFFTDFNMNTDKQQQHVLFQQKGLNTVILSFEDQLTSQVSDKDFNDIIFMVTDNKSKEPVSRFNLSNVPVLE